MRACLLKWNEFGITLSMMYLFLFSNNFYRYRRIETEAQIVMVAPKTPNPVTYVTHGRSHSSRYAPPTFHTARSCIAAVESQNDLMTPHITPNTHTLYSTRNTLFVQPVMVSSGRILYGGCMCCCIHIKRQTNLISTCAIGDTHMHTWWMCTIRGASFRHSAIDELCALRERSKQMEIELFWATHASGICLVGHTMLAHINGFVCQRNGMVWKWPPQWLDSSW